MIYQYNDINILLTPSTDTVLQYYSNTVYRIHTCTVQYFIVFDMMYMKHIYYIIFPEDTILV